MSVHEHLRCPTCRAGLLPADEGALETAGSGILLCHCAEHPVLDGVVCINDGAANWREGPAVLERLKSGRPDLAVAEALLPSHRLIWRRVIGRLERAGLRTPRLLHDWLCFALLRRITGRITFARAVHQLRRREYAMYLVQRWAIPSQHAAIPLILLLGFVRHENGSSAAPLRVLEVAGGAGHSCAVMLRYHPSHEVILTDADFANLWLARRFVAPGAAAYVRVDAERTLPFVGSSMDAIFCCDGFHFIRNQAGLAAELDRITRPGGVWVLPHLHNSLGMNLTPGVAHTPAVWRESLTAASGGRRDVRLLREDRLLRDFIEHVRIDLAAPDAEPALEACAALAAVVAPRGLWREYDLGPIFHDSPAGLDINPVYAAHARRGRVFLRRHRFRGLLRLEAEPAVHLPATLELEHSFLDALRRGRIAKADEPLLARLRQQMVIIPRIGSPRLGRAAAAAAAEPDRKHTREDSNLRPAV